MANIVRNRLVIKASEPLLQKITDFLAGEPDDEGKPCHIDFDKITPMPEALNIEECGDGDFGLAILQRKGHAGRTYAELRKTFDAMVPEDRKEILKLGRQYSDNVKLYGHKTWYDWSVANWGTKWNAYNGKMPKPDEIWFDTAWSCVHGLVCKLSLTFPEALFDYTFADEDTGANCGRVVLKNGKGKMHAPKYGSKEAYELAFEMRPELRSRFSFDGTTYHRIEEC